VRHNDANCQVLCKNLDLCLTASTNGAYLDIALRHKNCNRFIGLRPFPGC